MADAQYREDSEVAAKACEGLRAGEGGAIAEIFDAYAPTLAQYARFRLYHPDTLEDVLSLFWVRLMDGRAICRYDGRASLRTYLTSILEYQIRSANRRLQQERDLFSGEDLDQLIDVAAHDAVFHGGGLGGGGGACAEALAGTGVEDDCEAPTAGLRIDEALVEQEMRRILRETIGEALLELSARNAAHAELVWMRLCGLSFPEIARIYLLREDPSAEITSEVLGRKENALTQQGTRTQPTPGCLWRFRDILVRRLEERGLEPLDLFD